MNNKTGTLIGFIAAVVWAVIFLWLGLWAWNIPFNFSSFGCFSYYGILVIGVPLSFVLGGLQYDSCMDLPLWTIPAILYILIAAIGGIASSPMAQSRTYAAQLSVPEATSFNGDEDIAPFDPTQIPWVSEEYAQVLGDKLIGTMGAIGSSVEMGEYVRQEVNGKLFFVAPILHSGFFKYQNNPEGTPGYIMVSMTDDNDVCLINTHKIRVQPSGHAAWNDKLERVIQNHAPGTLCYEYKFEVDDELNPYWVVPIYKNQIGCWGGKEITRVAIVDATNGDNIQIYGLDEVPEWVDRVYPTDLIEDQLKNWGEYSGGYLNTWFGRTNLLQSDEGNAVVYSDGDCYLFDSLTSAGGSDEATVGFVLVNMRTKAVRYFSLAGATEFAACQSALGDERVKAQNYEAIFPLPTLVEGQPTYFIPLADPSSNMIKSFALVNIQTHQTVGIGTTIRDAERDYRAKLRSTGATSLYTSSADLVEITGRIKRWGAYTQNGNTYYLFVVGGHEDKLLLTDTSVSEAMITKEGDRVKIEAIATENSSWTVFSFDNLEFEQALGEVEEIVTEEEYHKRLAAVQEDPNVMDDSKFKEFWNLLTPEQQQSFLEQSADEKKEVISRHPAGNIELFKS